MGFGLLSLTAKWDGSGFGSGSGSISSSTPDYRPVLGLGIYVMPTSWIRAQVFELITKWRGLGKLWPSLASP